MMNRQELIEIKRLIEEGYTISYITRHTNKSHTTIYRIKNNLEKNDNDDILDLDKTPKKLLKFKKLIQKLQKQGIDNIQKLYRQLEKHGYRGNYQQIYRYVTTNVEKDGEKRKFVQRYETDPGEQAQVDWGRFGNIVVNGQKEPLYAFAYVLGYSRMKYIEFTVRQNEQTLLNCHIHAFEQLGIPKTILYDNMKQVVLERDRNDNLKPTFNLDFENFAKHYGFAIDLSHPYWPREKGKVESVIKTIRNDFMNGMKFGRDYSSLEDLNKKIAQWLDNDLNKRIHRSTGERPFVRFEKEKKYLHFPQTSKKYETSLSEIRFGTKYAMVQYKYNSYSVPPQFARKKLILKERSEQGVGVIDIYYKNKFIDSHLVYSGRNKWIQKENHFKILDKKINRKIGKRKKQENEKILHTSFRRPLIYYDSFLKG